MKTCIFANGSISDYSFTKKYVSTAEFIICCDGGLRHVHNLNIKPDCLLGDFDSVESGLFSIYKEMPDVEILEYPAEKDYTDLELALDVAEQRGATEIFILGGTGSRLDHTLANTALLIMAMQKKISALMADENNIIRAIDSEISLAGKKNDILSLVPVTEEVCGVRTEGLKFPLKNETLKRGSTRGLSNEFLGNYASVKIESGILFVIQSWD